MTQTTTIPRLETERLILRGPRAADYDAMADFLRSDRASYVGGPIESSGMGDYRISRAFGAMAGQWVLRGYGLFIITRRGDDTALGMVGPFEPMGHPAVEMSWSLWRSVAEGNSIAFEAASAARDWTFQNFDFDMMPSFIDAENKRSRALAERLGAYIDPGLQHLDADAVVYRHDRGIN